MNTETKAVPTGTINIMVDIESGGRVPGSSIFAIGAVAFALESDAPLAYGLDTQCYVEIDRDSCKLRGLKECPETMVWWSTQSEEAKKHALYGEVYINTALVGLLHFIGSFRDAGYRVRLWCKQNNFDFSLLEAAYETCDIVIPWSFRELRDCRTVFEMFPYFNELDEVHFRKGLIPHHALCDATYQARKLENILNLLWREGLYSTDTIMFLLTSPTVEEEVEEGDSDGE